VIKETFGEGLDSAVEQAVNKAIEQLKNLGAEVQKFPALPAGLPTYYIIAPSSFCKPWLCYDGVKYGFRAQILKIC